MTDETRAFIEEVKGRCEKASSPRWKAWDNSLKIGEQIILIETDNPTLGDSSNDTRFISFARTDLPTAIQIIEEQDKEIEKFKQAKEVFPMTCQKCGHSEWMSSWKVDYKDLK